MLGRRPPGVPGDLDRSLKERRDDDACGDDDWRRQRRPLQRLIRTGRYKLAGHRWLLPLVLTPHVEGGGAAENVDLGLDDVDLGLSDADDESDTDLLDDALNLEA